MKTPKPHASQIARLRKIINKSQVQFAAMIGVSKHTVISVENGRNQLTRKLARRIHEATGADLMSDDPDNLGWNRKYTAAEFNLWREKWYPSNEASARKRFDEMKKWLKIVFLAAARSGLAGNRDRLPAVSLSFIEWLEETREKFKLENQIEDVLPDETREVGLIAYTISNLLEDPKRAKDDLSEHNIDFKTIKKRLKPYASNGCLIVEDERRAIWSPNSPFSVVVETRKLIPEATCWIRTFDPNDTSGKQLMELLRPREPHEVLLKLHD
jgi:DNA-binding XRE family transcriptional regulator